VNMKQQLRGIIKSPSINRLLTRQRVTPSSRSIRPGEQTVEETGCRCLVSKLDHVDDASGDALVAQLDRDSSPADPFHSVGQDDGGD